MRILLATGIYPPDIGGPATYAAQLFERLPKRGIEVSVITYGDRKVKSQKSKTGKSRVFRWEPRANGEWAIVKTTTQNSKIVCISRRMFRGIRHLMYFGAVLWHGRRADIIYALDTVSAGLPAAIAAKVLQKPFVAKVVGDYAWEQYQVDIQHSALSIQHLDTIEEFQKQRYGFVAEMRRLVQKWAVRSAHIVITPSEYLKNIIAGLGIRREKIMVVPNAVIITDRLPSKEEARARLGLSGIVLLSAGRLVPWKGFRTLISIMAEIKNHLPDAQLLIIGSGPEKEALKAHVRAEALEANVKLVGGVPRDTLWQYLRASDIFLLNTAYEGFSHQIIEAMAVGVPVITTAIGGNPEIIENGKEGFLVPYDDAETFRERIMSLLADKKQYAEIQEKAKEKAGQFSLERMLTEIMEVFDTVRPHLKDRKPRQNLILALSDGVEVQGNPKGFLGDEEAERLRRRKHEARNPKFETNSKS